MARILLAKGWIIGVLNYTECVADLRKKFLELLDVKRRHKEGKGDELSGSGIKGVL